MNKLRPSERLVRILALSLCLLLYAGGGIAGYFLGRGPSEEDAISIHVNAVNLSFAQMELVAVEESPAPEELEPLPLEVVDIALKEIVEEPDPDLSADALAKEEPVQADALVNQEASSASEEVTADALAKWVLTQIQTEKYYPLSAQRAGYEGVFDLLVIIDEEGVISEATITYGRGHPVLRRSLEKILETLIGRSFGQSLTQAVEMPVEFEFELQ